jgi:hypothetical protein
MATVPDGQPAGTDVVGIAVSAPVASVMYTPGPIVVGLGGGPVTGPCPPPPATVHGTRSLEARGTLRVPSTLESAAILRPAPLPLTGIVAGFIRVLCDPYASRF